MKPFWLRLFGVIVCGMLEDCANCEDPGAMIHRIEKRIELIGSLDEVQRVRLLEIADRCPVHRTLTSRIEIRSALVSASE